MSTGTEASGDQPSSSRVFAESWAKRWTQSTWKKDSGEAGEFTLTSGKWYGDATQAKGVQTGPDARFFAYYAGIDPTFSNEGKDLVLQVCLTCHRLPSKTKASATVQHVFVTLHQLPITTCD